MVQVTLLNIWLMSMWRLKYTVLHDGANAAAAGNLSSVLDRVKIMNVIFVILDRL